MLVDNWVVFYLETLKIESATVVLTHFGKHISISVGWYMTRSRITSLFRFTKWCQKFSRVVVSIILLPAQHMGEFRLPLLGIFPFFIFYFNHSSVFVTVLSLKFPCLYWPFGFEEVFKSSSFLSSSLYILYMSSLWNICFKYTLGIYFKLCTHLCKL